MKRKPKRRKPTETFDGWVHKDYWAGRDGTGFFAVVVGPPIRVDHFVPVRVTRRKVKVRR